MRRLLTVEDTFALSEGGLVVAPMPPLRALREAGEIEVELRRPDGTRRAATLTVAEEFVHPTPAERRWTCTFRSLGKADVPVGTEIWCADAATMPSLRIAR